MGKEKNEDYEMLTRTSMSLDELWKQRNVDVE